MSPSRGTSDKTSPSLFPRPPPAGSMNSNAALKTERLAVRQSCGMKRKPLHRDDIAPSERTSTGGRTPWAISNHDDHEETAVSRRHALKRIFLGLTPGRFFGLFQAGFEVISGQIQPGPGGDHRGGRRSLPFPIICEGLRRSFLLARPCLRRAPRQARGGISAGQRFIEVGNGTPKFRYQSPDWHSWRTPSRRTQRRSSLRAPRPSFAARLAKPIDDAAQEGQDHRH